MVVSTAAKKNKTPFTIFNKNLTLFADINTWKYEKSSHETMLQIVNYKITFSFRGIRRSPAKYLRPELTLILW